MNPAGNSTGSTSATNSSTAANSGQAAAKAAAQSLITSLGSGSGVDINSLANNLVQAERAPQQAAIQSKIDKSNTTISGFQVISYVLGQLQGAFENLKDVSDFNSVSSTNSQPEALKATATSAETGSHDVIVHSIAQPQRTISRGFGKDESLNDGDAFDLTIQVHDEDPITVSVAANADTPQGVVNSINKSGSGIKASLINDGTGTNSWRIILTGPPAQRTTSPSPAA